MVIEQIFQHADAISRHKKAPMLFEREAYLAHLVALGRERRLVAEYASTLCQVVDLLGSVGNRSISEADILTATHRWQVGTGAHRNARHFKAVARGWAKFSGYYVPKDRDLGAFDSLFDDFVRAMQLERGYRLTSVRSFSSPVRLFLVWANRNQLRLASLTIVTLSDYFNKRRASGCSARTVARQCTALRVFLMYAEEHHLCSAGLSTQIRVPRSSEGVITPQFPHWKRVRQIIASVDDRQATGLRAKPILLLAAVYGLRCSEISRLTLDDLDWRNEILTVQRSKRGRVQQFPLQYEVGEAIIKYLEQLRPPCQYRCLFLTLKTPYRPVQNLGPAMRTFLRAHGMSERPCGLHALRHACATELLRRGTSLKGIADFLGHRNLRSVGIYARSDIRSLRKVADFPLSTVS